MDTQNKVITVNGYRYEVKIIDSTHLSFKPEGIDRWGCPLHIAQLDDDFITELKKVDVL